MSKSRNGIPLCYVAMPLNDDACGYLQNVHKMIVVSEKIRRSGFSVFVPCLDLLTGIVMGNMKYDDFYGNNLPWLLVSDCAFFGEGWRYSNGCKGENAIAEKNRIPRFYEIPEMIHKFESRLGASKT